MWISIFAQLSVSELSVVASFESFAETAPNAQPGSIARYPYQSKLDVWVPDTANFGIRNSISQLFLEDGNGYTASSILAFASLAIMGCRKPTPTPIFLSPNAPPTPQGASILATPPQTATVQ